jgi:uncharacterized protein
MTYKEFDSKFKDHVAKLTYEQQLVFALEICKKMFFEYQQFYNEYEWGNPDTLLDAIHLIEQSKLKRQDSNQVAATIKKVEEVTPDTEDFGEANYALNACTAVWCTLNFLLENKPEHIYYVGTSLYDTVDARVQGDEDLSQAEIDQHPAMVETRKYLLQEKL